MTPENDKTLRAIFRPIKRNVDDFPDRRQYREKYERSFSIDDRSNIELMVDAMSFQISKNVRKLTATIIRDNKPTTENDEDYISRLINFFPESDLCRKFMFYMSFGMARDIDGNFSNCDCCGRDLHALNCGGKHGMCDECQEEYYISKNKLFDIR